MVVCVSMFCWGKTTKKTPGAGSTGSSWSTVMVFDMVCPVRPVLEHPEDLRFQVLTTMDFGREFERTRGRESGRFEKSPPGCVDWSIARSVQRVGMPGRSSYLNAHPVILELSYNMLQSSKPHSPNPAYSFINSCNHFIFM